MLLLFPDPYLRKFWELLEARAGCSLPRWGVGPVLQNPTEMCGLFAQVGISRNPKTSLSSRLRAGVHSSAVSCIFGFGEQAGAGRNRGAPSESEQEVN